MSRPHVARPAFSFLPLCPNSCVCPFSFWYSLPDDDIVVAVGCGGRSRSRQSSLLFLFLHERGENNHGRMAGTGRLERPQQHYNTGGEGGVEERRDGQLCAEEERRA